MKSNISVSNFPENRDSMPWPTIITKWMSNPFSPRPSVLSALNLHTIIFLRRYGRKCINAKNVCSGKWHTILFPTSGYSWRAHKSSFRLIKHEVIYSEGICDKSNFFTVGKFELKPRTDREKRMEEGELLLLVHGSEALAVFLSRSLFLDDLQCVRSNV